MRRSISIDFLRRAPRGSAEIEMLTTVFTLVAVFFLVQVAGKGQLAIERTETRVHHDVFKKATTFSLPALPTWGAPRPVRPRLRGAPSGGPRINRLPNRVYTATTSETVRGFSGVDGWLRPVTFRDRAAVAGPSWTWTGTPHFRDAGPIRSWYNRLYRKHLATVRRALRIRRQ